MRIALNLHGFRPGCGGVETYLRNLLETLPLVDKSNEYLILCDRLGEKWLGAIGGSFDLQVEPYEKPGLRWFARGIVQRASGCDLLARSLRNVDADVIHHPLTVLNPRNLPHPSVLTFHDLQQEYHPEFFSADELRRRRASYFPSVQEATAIIAVSSHAKDSLIERYGLPAEKIHVVYHGLSGCFRRINENEELEMTVRKYDLHRPFMFYPAGTWLHKNHLQLLKVIRRMVDCGSFDGELLLTGAAMEAHEQVIAEISHLQLEGVVRWLGYLPEEDLPRLYNLARMLVFPSLFEGFGLPVLEAMACGCPVACSDVTSLPEVGGDAAIYFNPEVEDDFFETLKKLWNREELCSELRLKGELRSRMFSWKETAEQTVDVYRSVYMAASKIRQ